MLTTLGYMFPNIQLTWRSYMVVLYDYFRSSVLIKSTPLYLVDGFWPRMHTYLLYMDPVYLNINPNHQLTINVLYSRPDPNKLHAYRWSYLCSNRRVLASKWALVSSSSPINTHWRCNQSTNKSILRIKTKVGTFIKVLVHCIRNKVVTIPL